MLHYLDGLQETNLLVNTPFIPDDEIFLKIGGDHGGGSFKMSFEVANVEHPNKPENIVLFSVMEAKDNKSNLMLCLERFKTHIAMFEKVKWLVRGFKVLLFGDNEFLCTMYGLSGASGKHPCLWCHITKDYLCIPQCERTGMFSSHTLDLLKNDFDNFIQQYSSKLAKAKFVNNVIRDIFFKIPLEYVCVLGLHITLGVYMKLLHSFEHYAKQLDVKIAEKMATENKIVSNDDEMGEFIKNLNLVIDGEEKIQVLEERRTLLLEELSWFGLTQEETFDEDFHRELLDRINHEIQDEVKRVKDAKVLTKELDAWPCFTSIDPTLKEIGVEWAKYFCGTIVGND